jgi:hypothetical protein
MTSTIGQILQQERARGLASLTGSRLSASIPVREAFLNSTVARLLPPQSTVEAVHVGILPANRLDVTAAARVFGFRKTVRLGLHVQPLIDATTGWTGNVAFAERSLVSWLIGMAGPLAGALPPGVTLSDNGIAVELPPLLSKFGAGDLMPHLSRITFETETGILWISAAIEIVEAAAATAAPSPGAPGPRAPGEVRTVEELQAAFTGAMADLHLRIAAPLANALLAGALDDAAAASPPAGSKPNLLATVRPWIERQLLSFEEGAMVLDVVGRVRGERLTEE